MSPDHEYTVHEVPHPDITNKDNYFKSITEVSRFTNPHFTRELKVEVKRRAGNKCECCGRSWQDVETFDDERFYFETLSWQDIESLNDFKKLPELATKTLIGYRYATITDGLHKNGKPRERIVQLFPETCKNCRAHLSWFIGFSNLKPIKASRWFQVHHKNFAHFDNRLENLEYLCGNCHGAKGRSRSDNATTNSRHGRDYVRNLLSYMKTRGITLSYIFLDKQESFSFALIGERQDH